jgi:choice-of-anchor C domain-containing protein
MNYFKFVCAAGALGATALASSQLVNGDLKSTSLGTPGTFVTLASGNTQINGWTVGDGVLDAGSGSVDFIGALWQAPPGETTSVDLDGNNPGSISQTVTGLTVGWTYTLNFYLSGNPDGPPATKVLMLLGGAIPNTFTYTLSGNTYANMMYQLENATFTASTTSELIKFSSDDPAGTQAAWGPVVGGVHLAPSGTPEPFTMALGLAGIGLAVRRRLKAKA